MRCCTGNLDVYQRLLEYSSPHLPKTLEVAQRGDDGLILEEYIEGDTLDYLLRGALFSAKETRAIVLQICQALWVLHSIPAVHRDVKPENIILRGNHAVLIDFDAARVHKPGQENDTQILGTTGFAAPEQYGLSQCDARADIYSIGVLINVMLTGAHPSKTLVAGKLGRVVERCTHVNPEKRYRDIRHLMASI